MDIEIRPHNRVAIEAHPLSSYNTLIEGSSIAREIVERVRRLIVPDERVLVLLDSNHARAHVFAKLEAYAPLVRPGSYIGAADEAVVHGDAITMRASTLGIDLDRRSWREKRWHCEQALLPFPSDVVERSPFRKQR